MQLTKIHKNMKSGHHKQAFASICAGAHGEGKNSVHTERFSLRLRLILTAHPILENPPKAYSKALLFVLRESAKEKARSVVTLPPVCFHFSPKHVVLIACCCQILKKKTTLINFQHWNLIMKEDWASKRKKCNFFRFRAEEIHCRVKQFSQCRASDFPH